MTRETCHDDEDTDTGVYIDPLKSEYYYDPETDIEYVRIIADEPSAYGADPFNIIAAREERQGCPMAKH